MTDSSPEMDAPRLRPNLKPLILALLANVLFGGVLLGIPFSRGRDRARAAPQHFARFSACFFDGEARRAPGLTLPRGERARYATLVLRGEPAWPERCYDELARIAPPESRFLFPGIKDAEAQVRAAVALTRRELEVLEGDRPTRVPERPLRAIGRLQAALVQQVLAAAVDIDVTHEAISLESAGDLATPSIVPIRIATGGRWEVALVDGVLLATAMDRRGVGHVQVEDGGVVLQLARRSSLVSGVLGARSPPWISWSTSSAQCASSSDRCARRATGLTALVQDQQRLLPEQWFAAHPLGEAPASIAVDERRVWIAARTAEGAELRSFDRAAAEGSDPSVPRAPIASWTLPITVEAGVHREIGIEWLAGDPPGFAFADGTRGGVFRAVEEREPIVYEAVRGAFVRACERWVLVGEDVVARNDGSIAHRVELRVRPAARDSVRVVCDGEAVHVFALDDGALRELRCDDAGCSPIATLVADDVQRFDALRWRGSTLLAYVVEEEGAVQVLKRSGTDQHRLVPAACWDPAGGMCGEPRLVTDGSQLMLVTREGTDLRVLRSGDGLTWRSLEGLDQP